MPDSAFPPDFSPRKIVLLRASRIGDFINTFPAFHSVRLAYPKAEISLITLPMLKDIALRNSDINRVLPFPGYPGLAEQLFEPEKALRFIQQMQAEKFDLAIQFQGSGINANPFLLMCAAQFTAGFVRSGDGPGLLSSALPLPETGHESQRMLALSYNLGFPAVDPIPHINLWPEDFHAADDLLADAVQPWIGLHTSARDHTRRWPLERFVETCVRMQSEVGGTVIVIGEQAEREIVGLALSSAGVSHLNLAGLTSLPVTAAVLSRLNLFLTNDTGPAHLAYAVDTPTIVLFGSADPARYGPLLPARHRVVIQDISCRPCGLDECPIGTICLTRISVEQVVTAALDCFFAAVQEPH